MTITTTKLTDYELLDASGSVLRTVRGEATAVILRNAGECASFRPVQKRVALIIGAGTTVAELVKFAALAQAAEDEPSPEFEPTDEYLREEMEVAVAAGAVFEETEEDEGGTWGAPVDVTEEVHQLEQHHTTPVEEIDETTSTIVHVAVEKAEWKTVERDIVDPAAEEQAIYAASAVWKAVPKPEVAPADLNARFAMANPVKPDYASKKIGDLRKLASQAGMRAATGIDPYKGASKEQLLDFLER